MKAYSTSTLFNGFYQINWKCPQVHPNKFLIMPWTLLTSKSWICWKEKGIQFAACCKSCHSFSNTPGHTDYLKMLMVFLHPKLQAYKRKLSYESEIQNLQIKDSCLVNQPVLSGFLKSKSFLIGNEWHYYFKLSRQNPFD